MVVARLDGHLDWLDIVTSGGDLGGSAARARVRLISTDSSDSLPGYGDQVRSYHSFVIHHLHLHGLSIYIRIWGLLSTCVLIFGSIEKIFFCQIQRHNQLINNDFENYYT